MKRLLQVTAILALAFATAAAQEPEPAGALETTATPNVTENQLAAEEPSTPAARGFSPLRMVTMLDAGEAGHSYLYSTIRYSNRYESDYADTSFVVNGDLNFLNEGKHTETAITTSSGGTIHSKLSGLDSIFERMAASETFRYPKWNLSLIDQFDYLPESNYGNYLYGSMDPMLIDQLSQFLPDVSMLLAGGQHYSNSAMVTGNRTLSHRSALQASGSYSFLEFVDSGYVSYRSYQANATYRHDLFRRDSVQIDYAGQVTHFGGSTKMQTHRVNLGYTHYFPHGWQIDLSAGPQPVLYTDAFLNLKTTHVVTNGQGALVWNHRATSSRVTYLHGTGMGGGLLRGARNQSVVMAVSQSIGRNWKLNLDGGYATNSSISGWVSSGTTPLAARSYDSAYAGFAVNRKVGRWASVFLNYSFQYQTFSSSLAGTSSPSSPIYRRHMVMAGFDFNLKPFVVR